MDVTLIAAILPAHGALDPLPDGYTGGFQDERGRGGYGT